MREWLTVIVVLLIVGILLDGWRRMRNARRDNLRMSPGVYRSRVADPSPARIDDDFFTSELPNGGARVVRPGDPAAAPKPKAPTANPSISAPRARIPQQVTLNLDEAVPLLMESVEEENLVDEVQDVEHFESDYAHVDTHTETLTSDDRLEPGFSALDDDDPLEAPRPAAASPRLSAREPEPAAPSEPEEVLIINIMAHDGQRFAGDELLDVVLRCGMRYGSMNIFHRHSDARGDGVVLFSMANMVKPGTFDLDAMDEFTTPGVSLFMTLPLNVESSIQAFETMLDSARRIAEALGGELKDENRSVMTRQTMEHCRQRIRDFERKQLSRMPH